MSFVPSDEKKRNKLIQLYLATALQNTCTVEFMLSHQLKRIDYFNSQLL